MVKKPLPSKSARPPKATAPSQKIARELEVEEPSAQANPEELKRQQTILNVFRDAFQSVLRADDFNIRLQEVKQALFDRNFEAAFGSEAYLEVYAARWSPTRVLCYSRVLLSLREHLGDVIIPADALTEDVPGLGSEKYAPGKLRMLSIGGGAAELAAFASLMQQLDAVVGDIVLLDVGPWKEIIGKLYTGVTTLPELSKYASAAAKAANAPLLEPSRLSWTFREQDVLALGADELAAALGKDPLLVTMLFTLNELYTTGGIAKTTSFLRNLSATIASDSLLLVVDSPGSYSEAAVGKEAKKYPMQWLLDHTLMQADKLPVQGCQWERLESDESVWYRLTESLQYPIQLENMRYQIHLYRSIPRAET